jgi:Tfp pilus assembly protein PilX
MTIMLEDKKKRKQRGVALLIAIFALLLVTGIALAMMSMADTETSINANYRDSQKAYFSALAGIQEARVRILTENTNVVSGGTGGVLPNGGAAGMPANSNATGVVYILNSNGSDTIQPWTTTNNFYDDELCHENYQSLSATWNDANRANPNINCATTPGASGWYTTKTSTDPNTGTSAALDYKWVRISKKENRSATPFYVADTSVSANNNTPICWDGLKQFPLPSTMSSCTDHSTGNYYESVYRVASLARTKLGTRRMVLAEVANTPPLMTNAAVDSQDHVTLNGQLNVNGFDACSCNLGTFGNNGYSMNTCTATTTGSGSNQVTTYNCPSRSPYTCDNSKYAIYAAGTVDNPNSSETIVAGPNPPIAQSQPWNYDIPNLINNYKPGAVPVTGAPYNYTCTANTYDSSGNLTANGSCGTHAGGTYGVPPPFPPTYDSSGNLTYPSNTSPSPYTQVTYVPGNLQMTGGSIGSGILIVDGDLDIHGGLQFYGLILVRGVVKFTGGGSDQTNVFGAVLAGQESYVDNTLGGSASINFSSCALKQNQTPQPPRLISIREATY